MRFRTSMRDIAEIPRPILGCRAASVPRSSLTGARSNSLPHFANAGISASCRCWYTSTFD